MQSLPWFKWSPSEWLSGDIQYCSDASQLLFVKLCCIYWKNDCQLTVKVMRKRCQMRAEKLQKCVKELHDDGMICVKDDNISIKFLDEQYIQRIAKSEVNAINGKLGGKANGKRTVSERSEVAKHKEIDVDLDLDLEGEVDETDPFTPSQELVNIDPSTEWHSIKSQAWVTSIKDELGKIGPNNWIEWKGIIDRNSLELILAALPDINPDDRWPTNTLEKIMAYKDAVKVSEINGAKGFFG